MTLLASEKVHFKTRGIIRDNFIMLKTEPDRIRDVNAWLQSGILTFLFASLMEAVGGIRRQDTDNLNNTTVQLT